MFLNQFAETLAPTDMTASDEFTSLKQSAKDLGIAYGPDVRYASREMVVRGLRFHFLEWGPSGPAAQPQRAGHQGEPGAPPVLLLHGGNQSAHSWDLVSLHLADRYHVLALDQRGHGDSEWSREIDYSIEAKAADALAFIADQKLRRPIVMGHSMGGAVSMRVALTQPDAMRGLVLVDVGPELSQKGIEVVHDFVVRNVEFDDLDEFLDNVVRYDRFRSREHIARTVKYNMLRRADGKYVSKVDHRRVPATPGEPLILDDVAAISCPVLLVRGAESNVLEPEAAERFVDALPNGRLVTVPEAGHNVHGANTPGFLEAVVPFLAVADVRPVVRLLHTSDVHVAGDDLSTGALRAVVDTAVESDVDVVLIAGDLFDNARLGAGVVDVTIGELARLGRPAVVIPGNHDCVEEPSIWQRVNLSAAGDHVRFVGDPAGEQLVFEDLALAVWARGIERHEPRDRPLEGYVPADPGYWSVVVTHGHYVPTGEQSDRSSPITQDEIGQLGCDYLALGHWHRFLDVSEGGVTAFYPGSPSDFRGESPTVNVVTLHPETGVAVERRSIG